MQLTIYLFSTHLHQGSSRVLYTELPLDHSSTETHKTSSLVSLAVRDRLAFFRCLQKKKQIGFSSINSIDTYTQRLISH